MTSRDSSLGASPTPDTSISAPHYRSARTHPQIKIEPTCLVFPPPHFGRCIQNAISIYNVSKQPCVFKMRSQNPERYVAKPHVAIVAPESATRIFVTLRDMNTLGLKNLPEDTHDRFRISLKLYDPASVDASLAPKELWSVLQERGAKVDHEQDLVSYFTKKDTPVGGLVTFFPPTYIPVTPTTQHRGPAGAAGGAGTGSSAPPSAGNGTASRGLQSDLNDAAGKKGGAAPPSSANKSGKAGSAAGGDGSTSAAAAGGKPDKAEKGKAANKMPALWVGIAVAAMVVVSLAVVVGVTLRGGNSTAAKVEAATEAPTAPPAISAAQQTQQRLQAARERLAQEAARLEAEELEQQRQEQRMLEAERARVAQAQAAEAEAQRLVQAEVEAQRQREREEAEARAAEEAEAERIRVLHEQQQQQQQQAAAEEAARMRAHEEEMERQRLQQQQQQQQAAAEEAARMRAHEEEMERQRLQQQQQQQEEEIARAQQQQQQEQQEQERQREVEAAQRNSEVREHYSATDERRTVTPQWELSDE